MNEPLSDALQQEIADLQRSALPIRERLGPALRRRLDDALHALDTLPQRYDSESAIRQALDLPAARIRNIVGAHGA